MSRSESWPMVLVVVLGVSSVFLEVKAPLIGVGAPNLLAPLCALVIIVLCRDDLVRLWPRLGRVFAVTLALYIWAFLSSVFGLDPGVSLRYWVKTVGYGVCWAGFLVLFARPDRALLSVRLAHVLLLGLAAGGVAEAIWPHNFFLEIVRSEGSLSIYPRISSFLAWPNQYGIVMGVGLCVGEILRRRGVLKPAPYAVTQLLFVTQVAQSGSRNAWASMAATMAFLVIRKGMSLKRAASVALVCGVVLVILPVSAYQLGFGRGSAPLVVHQLLDEEHRDSRSLSPPGQSLSLRSKLWRHVAMIIEHRPVAGIGLDIFQQRVGVATMHQPGFNAHNLLLNVAAETGLVGLALSVLWMITLVRARSPATPMVEGAVFLLFTGQIIDCFVYDYGFMVVLLFFTALLVSRLPASACLGSQSEGSLESSGKGQGG